MAKEQAQKLASRPSRNLRIVFCPIYDSGVPYQEDPPQNGCDGHQGPDAGSLGWN